ncbi:MAG TPA: DHA2 family efflux MFS transporter permease subunit, partial [Gammaproteobacteria bacterium]|nr:DHA2 family efflux MFS transporter permease subunit [Gammaproteobacteria bacterium]
MATIQEQASSHKYIITFVVMSATIMQVLDTTIVNVALPDMQGALNASPDEIAWVLTSYIVASAIFMPLTGYISDKIGRKKYLLGSMIGFTIASMFCGLSQNLSELVAFRLLQGVFGASLVPLSQAILAHTYPPEERGRAMAIWGMGVMLGPVLGPTLGGYFAEYMTWRWNFYVNVPVGIVTIILAIFYIDETEIKERSLDWFGFGLLALGIGMLQFTLDRGNQDNWFESNVICATAVLAFLGLSSFAVYSKYFAKNPIFNVEVLTNRNFYAASIIIAFLIMGLYGAMVLQPIMLNNLFYYPEFTIGLAMVPRGLASMFSMLFVPKLMSIMHPRYIVLIGIALSMFGNYVQTYYTLEADLLWMVWPLVFQG